MNILYPFRRIKWFFQRAKRGWADCDAWCMAEYLYEVLPQMLRKFAKDIHGCPDEFYDASRKGDECHLWEEAVIKMAEGFEAMRTLDKFWDFYTLMEDSEEVRKRKEDNKRILEERAEEGWVLFKKYFRSFWD